MNGLRTDPVLVRDVTNAQRRAYADDGYVLLPGLLSPGEAARLRDEVKRLEAVDLAVADDPLARQSAVEAEVEATVASPRSKAGRGGTRAYKGKSQRRMR